MSEMPIYSHIVPKSQNNLRSKGTPRVSTNSRAGRVNDTGQTDPKGSRPSRISDTGQFDANPSKRPQNINYEGSKTPGRPVKNEPGFDPLNYNQGGNFHLMNLPIDARYAGIALERERRKSKEERPRKVKDSSEGKVEAYLRQNQVSMRQQHRHSGVRQAEHRVNLRSLPLNEGYTPRGHDRTPSDRARGFPERDGMIREQRRERDAFDAEGVPRDPLSPLAPPRPGGERRARKSPSAQRPEQPTVLSGAARRFHCREWALQKLAHCLEQRPVSKTCGALILGDSGSGKTALCRELSQPGAGPQARQQRALNRRLLARHFLQGQNENSLRTGELVRTLVMQILSHSSRHRSKQSTQDNSQDCGQENGRSTSEEDRLMQRLREMGDDGEDISKPLLGDSEDQRTDEEEPLIRDAPLSTADELPVVLPRSLRSANTNPFLTTDDKKPDTDFKIYENHENLFLRNISQRQSKELRNSRLLRQSSEPLTDKKATVFQKSHSTEPKSDSTSSENEARDVKVLNNDARCLNHSDIEGVRSENDKTSSESDVRVSKPLGNEAKHAENDLKSQGRKDTDGSPTNAKISRIPVANFRYPNKSGLGSSSENSPHKVKPVNCGSDSPEAKDKSDIAQKEDVTDANNETADINDETEQNGNEIQGNDGDENIEEELPEYQNILKPRTLLFESDPQTPDLEVLLEKKRSQMEEVPPPIPSLPVNPRTVVANAYYEKLLNDPEMQQALLPHNLEKNPDECFKKALLFPLLEIDPPKQCLFLLVDSLDEDSLTGPVAAKEGDRNTNVSKTVAELLANHHHLFPQWLLLVCTARKQSKSLTKMFTGFRKIALDELQRAHVAADVQRYVLARLDGEPRLRARVSADAAAAAAAAAALDHLRIKSDGNLLYLEKVLDGIADGFIALREIREIPGTLNGLYLWLAQRLFHGRRFSKVRLMLDVLLAAKCGVTEEMLYKCLITNNYSVTRDDFNRRLHLLRRILVVDQSTGFLSIFHHSFCSWLLDVKHCTRRYLCSPALGHAALAMFYTLEAKRLTALEVHHFVLHMTKLEQHLSAQRKNKELKEDVLDAHTLTLLWLIDSGCVPEAAVRPAPSWPSDKETLLERAHIAEDIDEAVSSPGATPQADWVPHFLSSLHYETAGRDARVLRTLVEMGARPEAGAGRGAGGAREEREMLISASQLSLEEQLAEAEEEAAPAPGALPGALEEHPAHQLAQRGEEEQLQTLLESCSELAQSLDSGGGSALHAAARHGRAGCAGALLRAGARPDAADADGWTPLRAAAWAGHTEVVEVLLEFGCQVDCVDADNRTALRAAAWSGHEAAVSLLLAAGAAPDRADGEGRTPLIAAAYMGHAEIVRALLDGGADVDHADEDGRTALSVASLCATGAQCAALLLERGADVTKADRDKATPLLVAAFEGHTEICELLLEHESDPEACDAAGRSALWAAASAGHAAAVRLLLFWGACVDGMDAEGRTVLSVAAAQGNVEVVRQLLDRGLDEHHRDNAGWTPLHYAAFEGHTEVSEALLEAGAKVDEADNDGKGALMLAAQEGHVKLIEMLIDEWAAPVDQHAHDGKTALRLAALEGHLECVRVLHERGADADALDADRRSTLYVLALDNRLAMSRYLVRQCGAGVDTRDAEGRTPLHVSAWQGHTDMVNMLITIGGAEVDCRDRCMRTALHAAAWRGRAPVLRCLLQHGADPAAVCTQGATPLGIAAQEGHEECVMYLLQHGADPLQADHCGRTPAKVAWRAGHAGVCQLLERWTGPAAAREEREERPDTGTSGSTTETRPCTAALVCPIVPRAHGSPEFKRRSVHSSSTKSSSNLTGGSGDTGTALLKLDTDALVENSGAGPDLSFAQQVARCGRGGRRVREREAPIPEQRASDKDARLRSYVANEHDVALRGYVRERDRYRHAGGDASPLYASPPRSPISDICSPTQQQAPFGGPQPASVASHGGSAGAAAAGGAGGTATATATATDQHFARDTHMRIILGRDNKRSPPAVRERRGAYTRLMGSLGRVARRKISKQPPPGKSKRNGIVTNPAMRLVANVRSGLDNAAANIRRTGVALAASAGSSNPAVKTNAFQWRKETPL